MPQWVTTSDKSDSIKAHFADRPESLGWMKLFQPGRGFRVHLIPNVDERITNTFSLISADRERQYRLRSNSLGFRGPELEQKRTPGTFRILVFGDSSSFGWGVDDEDTYPEVLAQVLRARFPDTPIEVGNFAIPGDSTEFGRLIAEKIIPRFKPDFVIFGFGANDAHLTYTPHQVQIDRFREAGYWQDIRSFLEQSALVSSVTALANRKTLTPATPNRPMTAAVSLSRYSANLAELLRFAKGHSVRQSMIVSLCSPGNYRQYAENVAALLGEGFFDGQEYLKSRLRDIKGGRLHPEILQEMKQLYPADLAKNDIFYITNDGCHPNKIGYRLIGERLAELIAPAVTSVRLGTAS